MVMPKVVDHPADAYKLMDYWYTLDAAVPLTEYIGYYSPVKGVREQVLADCRGCRAPTTHDAADQLRPDRPRLIPRPGPAAERLTSTSS